jgi:hypothetical protein
MQALLAQQAGSEKVSEALAAAEARLAEMEKALAQAGGESKRDRARVVELETALAAEKQARIDAEAEARAARAAVDAAGQSPREVAHEERARTGDSTRIQASLKAELKDAKSNRDRALEMAFRRRKKSGD